MKPFLFILLFAGSISSRAQRTVDVANANVSYSAAAGEPFVFAKFSNLVEGTPYFRDEWLRGNIVLNEGNQYAGIFLKLDLYDNEVHYRDQKGNELIGVSSIQKLILFDTVAQQVFQFINGDYIQANKQVNGWYQLLAEGKAILFKQIKKIIRENKPDGSPTVEQTIISSSHYYILCNGNFTEIKKIKDLPGILADKKEEVARYIKLKIISGKSDDDFENLINYFNELK